MRSTQNQRSGNNRRPPPSGGNQGQQQQGFNPPAPSGGKGSNPRGSGDWQRSRRNQSGQQVESTYSSGSRGCDQQPNAPRGSGSFAGDCFSCGQWGHKATHCPQREPQFFDQRPTTSEPTVGNLGGSQRVYTAGFYPPTGEKGPMGPAH